MNKLGPIKTTSKKFEKIMKITTTSVVLDIIFDFLTIHSVCARDRSQSNTKDL